MTTTVPVLSKVYYETVAKAEARVTANPKEHGLPILFTENGSETPAKANFIATSPSCCGYSELKLLGLGLTRTNEELQLKIAYLIHQFTKRAIWGSSYLIYTGNDSTYGAYVKILQSFGFQEIAKVANLIHGYRAMSILGCHGELASLKIQKGNVSWLASSTTNPAPLAVPETT